MPDNDTSEPTYMPYPKAMQILRERLDATPAELAVWVLFRVDTVCEQFAVSLRLLSRLLAVMAGRAPSPIVVRPPPSLIYGNTHERLPLGWA